MERDSEERSAVNYSKRSSVHSDWSNLIPIDVEAEYWRIYRKRSDTRLCTSIVSLAAPVPETVSFPPSSPAHTHKTVKNIVLVLYTPKPNEWGSWWVKNSQCTSGTAARSNSVYDEEQEPKQEQQEEEIGQVYQPRSPYYSPVHPPEFYDEEQ